MSDEIWVVGFHSVLAALEGVRTVEVVWLLQGRRDGRVRRIEEAARRRGIQVRQVPRVQLDRIAGDVAHTGCAARTGPIAWSSLEDVIAPDGQTGRLLLLDGVTDPHNVGAVIRTAAAFAVDGLILAGPSAPPMGGAVERAAAGQLGRVRMVRANVAADVVQSLQGEGYWSFGADAAGAPVHSVSVPDRWILCVGAEQKGLRAKTRSKIDEMVAIPMATGVESLNLSVSTAVLLYDFLGPRRNPR
jgi:23S rRNA (guanosine2251-2'-O)-methyltransferase